MIAFARRAIPTSLLESILALVEPLRRAVDDETDDVVVPSAPLALGVGHRRHAIDSLLQLLRSEREKEGQSENVDNVVA